MRRIFSANVVSSTIQHVVLLRTNPKDTELGLGTFEALPIGLE
jgi:hypothetical protein